MEVFSYISIITKTFLYTATELKLVLFDYKILNILYFFVSFITILLQNSKSQNIKRPELLRSVCFNTQFSLFFYA